MKWFLTLVFSLALLGSTQNLQAEDPSHPPPPAPVRKSTIKKKPTKRPTKSSKSQTSPVSTPETENPAGVGAESTSKTNRD